MPLESCTRGHRVSKSSRDPKIMGYNPRKRPEMLEITSFDDAARVVYRGSRGIEILPPLLDGGLGVLNLHLFVGEIGRASCRERLSSPV